MEIVDEAISAVFYLVTPAVLLPLLEPTIEILFLWIFLAVFCEIFGSLLLFYDFCER